MGKVQKRTKCKSFVKYVNYNHMMPTRYVVPTEFDAKTLVTDEQMSSHETKAAARKAVKAIFDEKFTNIPTEKSRASSPRTSCTCARSCASKRARCARLEGWAVFPETLRW